MRQVWCFHTKWASIEAQAKQVCFTSPVWPHCGEVPGFPWVFNTFNIFEQRNALHDDLQGPKDGTEMLALGFVGNVSSATWAQAPVLPAGRERGKLLLREKVLDSCRAHVSAWRAATQHWSQH